MGIQKKGYTIRSRRKTCMEQRSITNNNMTALEQISSKGWNKFPCHDLLVNLPLCVKSETEYSKTKTNSSSMEQFHLNSKWSSKNILQFHWWLFNSRRNNFVWSTGEGGSGAHKEATRRSISGYPYSTKLSWSQLFGFLTLLIFLLWFRYVSPATFIYTT